MNHRDGKNVTVICDDTQVYSVEAYHPSNLQVKNGENPQKTDSLKQQHHTEITSSVGLRLVDVVDNGIQETKP